MPMTRCARSMLDAMPDADVCHMRCCRYADAYAVYDADADVLLPIYAACFARLLRFVCRCRAMRGAIAAPP